MGNLFPASLTRRTVHVRVTDTGVEIQPGENHSGNHPEVTIPLEEITRVQYNDPEGSYVRVLGDDAGVPSYLVTRAKYVDARYDKEATAYHDGVRIERENEEPVYVGSGQALELAETIARHAPKVARAEEFSP